MTKLTEWMKTHKRHMAAIAIAIVSFLIVAIVAFSNNENTSIKNEKSDKVTETRDVNSKEGADEEVNVDSEPADTISKPADKPSDGNANSSGSNSGNSNTGNSGNSGSTLALPATLEAPTVPTSRANLLTSIRGNSTPHRSGCPTW